MKNITAFLRDTEVAIRYGVSRPTIWRWTKNGKFPKTSQTWSWLNSLAFI